ncbi:hypothetical protein ACIA6C_32715 [Streptomyces sp. NPDC051578]|uniref:hypothetical protein n=1 Tax=Streptomyces sp. NPDC051578 TaxID=3365662 RepID=UPI0037A97620
MTADTLPALSGCDSSTETLTRVLEAMRLPVPPSVLDAICEDLNRVFEPDHVLDECESHTLASRLCSGLERLLAGVPSIEAEPTALISLVTRGLRALSEEPPCDPELLRPYLWSLARVAEDLLEVVAPFEPPSR